ncbi:MAG TPA: hypothetical protein VM735_04060, partial [Candidatus Kapabacteria bacterium]|nr:hypothetical protein [Candidatus Kapabacteria bacterium]
VLALLVVATLLAWRFEWRFSNLQHEQLHRLGEDIASNQEKWKGATVSDQAAFFWWKDLDAGHGITMETATLKQLGLLGMVLQLGITLAIITRRSNKLRTNQAVRRTQSADSLRLET